MKKSMTRRKSLRKKSITRKKSLRKKFMTRRKSLRKKFKDGMEKKISELEKRQESLRKTIKEEDFDKLIEEINKYKADSDPEPTTNIHMLLSKIKRNGNIELEEKYKNRALILCCQKGFYKIAKLLSETIINIDGFALISASLEGRIDIVKLLLDKKGIDVNYKNNGWTALMLASHKGNIDTVKLLLDRKDIDVNSKNKYGGTALISASLEGNIDTVKLLLDRKDIDVNSKSNDGWTALIKAFIYGRIDVVKLLLDRKDIDVNSVDDEGLTVLMMACDGGNIDIVKLLLDRKDIDVNSKNNDGWTALMIASQEGKNIDIVKLLLDRNTCYCNTSFDNTTALEIAVERQNEDIVKILLEHSKKQHMNSLEQSIKQRSRKITKLFDDIYKIKCSVCLEKQVEILFDCGHAVTCRECFDELPLPKCPICRQNITQIYSNIEAREFNSI